MRELCGVVVIALAASSACGVISGVSGYDVLGGPDDASVTLFTKDAGLAIERDVVGSGDHTSAPVGGDASDDVTLYIESGSTEVGVDSQVAPETDASDAGGPDDAAGLADVAPDAPPPPCGPMTCSHCCSAGMCVGGQSVATCGTGGADCKDCTSMGGACASNGSCTTPVMDAAPPPTCSASKCSGCVAGFQRGCCRPDQTCGCQWIYVPGSGCQ